MRRRDLIKGIAGSAAAWPIALRAQEPGRNYRIGFLSINFLATPIFSVNADAFIAEVTNLRLASIYQWPEDAEAGAMLSYGPRITEMYRMRGAIAAKVLRGTVPADIPIELPTKFELVVNLKTAKTIGIEMADSLLLRANKVIE